jgi:hypothetical protein
MVLSGWSAELPMTLKKAQRLAAPRDVPVMHSTIPVDMTIVCIDILEKILIESRKSHGQHPLSSDIVASGLGRSSSKSWSNTEAGTTLRLHEIS